MLLCILKGITTYLYYFQRVTTRHGQFHKKSNSIVVVWKLGIFARTFYFKNATSLVPKNSFPFSHPVLLKVLCLKKSDDYFCGRRRITYLCNNFVANKETVENLMGIYVT